MAGIEIDRVDHLVLTCADVVRTCAFYERVLGMKTVTFGGDRKALAFGHQKINLHPAGKEYVPHARDPKPGSGDFCVIAATPLKDVIAHLKKEGVAIEQGPVAKSGATGPITSVYFRDPDGNLVEVSNYD